MQYRPRATVRAGIVAAHLILAAASELSMPGQAGLQDRITGDGRLTMGTLGENGAELHRRPVDVPLTAPAVPPITDQARTSALRRPSRPLGVHNLCGYAACTLDEANGFPCPVVLGHRAGSTFVDTARRGAPDSSLDHKQDGRAAPHGAVSVPPGALKAGLPWAHDLCSAALLCTVRTVGGTCTAQRAASVAG